MHGLTRGTYDSLLDASEFIAAIEKRQGLKVACIEEIAYNLGYIDKNQVKQLAGELKIWGISVGYFKLMRF